MTATPLSSRVPDAGPPVVPSTPGITWRSATRADVDAITGLFVESGRIDHPQYSTSREEIAENFELSYIHPEVDTILGLDESGEAVAVGLAMLSAGQDTLVRSFTFGTVHPSRRRQGIGRQLAAWLDARVLQQLRSSDLLLPGWSMVYLDDREKDARSIFERLGYSPARYFFELRRDLAEPIDDIAVVEGIVIRHPDPGETEAIRLAKNDSFRDHWGSQPTTEEDWNLFIAREVARPDLSFVAVAANGDIAGFSLVEVRTDDWEGQGFSSAYVDVVGTTRAYRGRRIAPALLNATLRACAADGLQMAVLDVDAENPTGALALYQGLGFRQAERTVALTSTF